MCCTSASPAASAVCEHWENEVCASARSLETGSRVSRVPGAATRTGSPSCPGAGDATSPGSARSRQHLCTRAREERECLVSTSGSLCVGAEPRAEHAGRTCTHSSVAVPPPWRPPRETGLGRGLEESEKARQLSTGSSHFACPHKRRLRRLWTQRDRSLHRAC